MFLSFIHRLQDLQRLPPRSATNRRDLQISPARLLEGLPELGSVLYLPMCLHCAPRRDLPRGLLVETMQLAPLLLTRTLAAASTITVEGPREWIDCLDREGRNCARLHLLPDTDYLAWDRLLDQGAPVPASAPSDWLRPPRPACASVLRFHLRRLAGLSVLGAEVCMPISALTQQLADQIARAEAVPLQPANSD